MRVDVLTLFPAMFAGPLQESILKRAQQRGLLTLVVHQLRDYALDRHQMTDDAPYGGGEGMVLRPEPLFQATRAILRNEAAPVVLMTPQGRPFTHAAAQRLAQQPRVLILCGHYEGIDERVRQMLVTEEISIGDYVLTGGELAAMVVIDALARFIPGVLGAAEGAHHDSYASGLLEGPQYTRPPVYAGLAAPDILRSGNHAAIARWQREMALQRTYERRPDLLEHISLSAADWTFLRTLYPSPSDEPPTANRGINSDETVKNRANTE